MNTVWIYVCDSNKDCNPEVRVYSSKQDTLNAVKSTFEEYVTSENYSATKKARDIACDEFKENNGEDFSIILDDGETIRCFAEPHCVEMRHTKDVKDIFCSEADVLVNPVNTVGVMGAGLAKQFKERFPEMFQQYRTDCMNKDAFEPGRVRFYGNSPVIACLATKNHFKNPSRVEWVIEGIRTLRIEIEREGLKSVAIPKVGCGLGGLDWNEVKPLILKELEGASFKVWLDGEWL